jgi:hypothetical protein
VLAATVEGTTALEEAVDLLVAEAASVEKNCNVLRDEPDFASRFDGAIDPDRLVETLTHRSHPDPFVDAYVRWQLTSFDPDLPELDDRAFLELMRHAPTMIENPRADPETVAVFRRVGRAGPLSARDRERLRELTRRLEGRAAEAEILNRPAVGFRRWVGAKLGDRGPRPRQWRLERCAATVAAGWPAASIKSAITRDLGTSASDQSLSGPERRTVAALAQRLSGLERRFVDQVTCLADGSVRVTFSTTGVDEDDVARWIGRLDGGTGTKKKGLRD